MPKIKAVIFDMDGVLIDARDWHFEALNKSLSLFGTQISRYEHLVTYDGLPTKRKLEMLTVERGLPRELHEFLNELKQQYTMDLIYSRCRPNFAHQYALSRLKHLGYRIVVCSNSVRETIELMMRRSGLIGYLDFFVSNQDVSNPKPHPEMYLNAITRLELQPRECVVVEDNPNGIKSATAAGAHVLEVADVDDVTIENVLRFIHQCEAA